MVMGVCNCLCCVILGRTDSPRRFTCLHWVAWLNALVGVVMVMVAHGHYTIDVLIAYYVTTRLFWTYHTMANNNFLLKVITFTDSVISDIYLSIITN